MNAAETRPRFRIGVDLGGTKIEIVALDRAGAEHARQRIPTPRGYQAIVLGIRDLVVATEQALGNAGSVGVGIPGVISPRTGLVKNANSTALNGHAFDRDLSAALERPVTVANDANCFALSEASDGAAAGHDAVFGVILGTGCGGGTVIDGRVRGGRNRVAGEWGHIPLPWARPDEQFPVKCWCGQSNCLELWVAGPALARDCDGPEATDAAGIPGRAAAGETRAIAALDRHADRLARGLAVVVNLIDPDIVVLGGGLSNMPHLYAELPSRLQPYVFSDVVDTPIVKNAHGDSSGVRGAAWLWPIQTD